MQNCYLSSLIVLAGLMIIRPVGAIDGDYATPYTAGQGPVVAGDGEITYGLKKTELPLSTTVGVALLVLGTGAALYGRLRPHKTNHSS